VKLLKIIFEVSEGLYAFGRAIPVPNADAVGNIAGPVKEPAVVGSAQASFMAVKEECGPHTGRRGSHGSTGELFPECIGELKDVVVHDEVKCFNDMVGYGVYFIENLAVGMWVYMPTALQVNSRAIGGRGNWD